jgi:hypothetical protein
MQLANVSSDGMNNRLSSLNFIKMERVNIEKIGLMTIDNSDLEDIHGGSWPQLFGGLVLAGIIADWDDFKAGLSGSCPKK